LILRRLSSVDCFVVVVIFLFLQSMKNLKTITLISLLLLLTSCGLKEVVGPNAEGGTTNSDSYQPVTKGSNWKYSLQVVGQSGAQENTITMTGDVMTKNGNTYYKATQILGTDTAVGYFAHTGSLYISHGEDDDNDEPYLDDSKPAGGVYIFKVTDATGGGTPTQYLGTILEKGISKTIGGKTFNNVIHTRVELQANGGKGYITTDKNEYYIAKGIGMIEIDAYLGSILLAKQTIVSYNIK
jgi:hypothetical protein